VPLSRRRALHSDNAHSGTQSHKMERPLAFARDARVRGFEICEISRFARDETRRLFQLPDHARRKATFVYNTVIRQGALEDASTCCCSSSSSSSSSSNIWEKRAFASLARAFCPLVGARSLANFSLSLPLFCLAEY